MFHDRINVVYCVDANVERGFYASVLSLLRKTSYKIFVYIITDEKKSN